MYLVSIKSGEDNMNMVHNLYTIQANLYSQCATFKDVYSYSNWGNSLPIWPFSKNGMTFLAMETFWKELAPNFFAHRICGCRGFD